MNIIEAKKALKRGKILTHRFFMDNEFVKINPKDDTEVIFEDDCTQNIDQFFSYRSEIFKEGWTELTNSLTK